MSRLAHVIPRRHPTCRFRALSQVCRICALTLLLAVPGSAQSIWEVTPYEIEVWVALEPHPRVAARWSETLPAQLQTLAESRVGPPWTLRARAAPNDQWASLLRGDAPDLMELGETHPEVRSLDKLLVAVVESDPEGYRLRVRELDVATRHWTEELSRTLPAADRLANELLELISDAFTPLARIERIDEEQVVIGVRGGALVRPAESIRAGRSPVEIRTGDILQPVIRKADRSGQVGPDGVEPIAWTVLIASEGEGSQLVCRFESGYRQPFRTRRSSRVEQLARRIKPRRQSTDLELVNRNTPTEPLIGYEVYAKTSESEEPHWLGRTDWRGRLTIDRDAERPVEILFVRNGQQLLGKLPIVPGDQALLTAPLRNDDLRLEAEGFLVGVQDSLVDLVARREVLASRIRRDVEAGELDRAEELLRELRRLDTQDDFARRVQQRRQRLSTGDAQVQQKIDQLFGQTRALLGRFLSQEQVDQLSRDLRSAQQPPPPADSPQSEG